jgi:hypothetical protein
VPGLLILNPLLSIVSRKRECIINGQTSKCRSSTTFFKTTRMKSKCLLRKQAILKLQVQPIKTSVWWLIWSWSVWSQQDKYERLTLHSIYRENWKSDSPDLESSSNKMKSNESQKLGQQFLNLQTFKYHLVQIKCSKVSNARFIFVFHWICHVEASVDGPNIAT